MGTWLVTFTRVGIHIPLFGTYLENLSGICISDLTVLDRGGDVQKEFPLLLFAGIILVEPDTSPVIRNYIINFNNKPNVSSIINRAEIMDRFWDLADIQQYPFEDITRGVGFY